MVIAQPQLTCKKIQNEYVCLLHYIEVALILVRKMEMNKGWQLNYYVTPLISSVKTGNIYYRRMASIKSKLKLCRDIHRIIHQEKNGRGDKGVGFSSISSSVSRQPDSDLPWQAGWFAHIQREIGAG